MIVFLTVLVIALLLLTILACGIVFYCKVTYLEKEEKLIANLTKRVDLNAYNIKQLSESCSQFKDLDIEIKVCQERVNHTMEMIEELKAKRSMDILDKLREKDKE
ncbi:hypothetical protein LOB97_00225 [Lactobacillus delbrueckii subsp. lactis]|uniref:hypothetical protein n=1 Tax=Lactobacillus delbrueckii TaxID=1584 RepID=UPI001E632CA9|nr:hypothetical protein [Lactobacillus delbrueckii]MCD5576427.1 hypothetical protein [Lactobacillus delbrueckii subsp. lactis]MCD5603281.1 hypothetical protein [Lactobacillus delbrueckii subsp. lactis]